MRCIVKALLIISFYASLFSLAMSIAKQVSLLPAGSQPWNIGVCTASRDRFAYCATLAIYIYQVKFTLSSF